MNEKEKTFSIEEEERALTAGALNDLFYLVDARGRSERARARFR